MASYIDNIFINARTQDVQAYTPDWNFLNQGQQILSATQKRNFADFAQRYNSIIDGDLTRQDNIELRDTYKVQANEFVKQVSGADLTDPRNVKAAGAVFTPLVDNKMYIRDIVNTRAINDGIQRAQSFANSPDSNDRMLYNPYSEQLLKYAKMDYQKASPDEALKMTIPKYVPGVNFRTLSKKVLDDYGMNVEFDEQGDGYIYTYKNGKIVEPAMMSAITRELMKDPAVSDYANTRVEAQFRNNVEASIATGLSRQEAQLQVANSYLDNLVTQIFTEEQLNNIRSYVDADTALNEHEKKMAEKPYTPGSPEDVDYQNLKVKVQKLEIAKQAAENYLNLVGPSSSDNKIERAKNIMLNTYLSEEFAAQAGSFALKDAEFKIKVDDLAKAASKGAGKDLNFDYADNIDSGAPGASVKEERDWAIADANALVERSNGITEIKRDAIKTASLMDVPEISALVNNVDIESLSPEKVRDLYNKIDDAFEDSENAKSSEGALLYLSDRDKINTSFASYNGYLNQKRNNNKVIVQELSKSDPLAKYLLAKNGRILNKKEFYDALGVEEELPEERVAPLVLSGVGAPVNLYLDDEPTWTRTIKEPTVYEKLIKKFTENYNTTIRKSGSPITSISAQIEGLQGEGYNYPRVSYFYDQKSPKSAARELAVNMYENLNNAPASISIGNNTGDEVAQSEVGMSLIKGVLRKLLTEQISSNTENRIQYEISFQDAAFGKADNAAYTIKFVDPSKLKEFILTTDLDDAGKAEFQKMIIDGFTVVMQDKDMVSRPAALSRKETALTTVFRANGNTINENISGYGYFKVAQKSNSPNTVIISFSQNGNSVTEEYPMGVMDDIYRLWRNQGYEQKKQQRLNAQK
jgi:hypothetical protein